MFVTVKTCDSETTLEGHSVEYIAIEEADFFFEFRLLPKGICDPRLAPAPPAAGQGFGLGDINVDTGLGLGAFPPNRSTARGPSIPSTRRPSGSPLAVSGGINAHAARSHNAATNFHPNDVRSNINELEYYKALVMQLSESSGYDS